MLKNRLVFDQLTASQGGMYAVVGDSDTSIPDNGEGGEAAGEQTKEASYQDGRIEKAYFLASAQG
ncbi:MAG: hypothetical protein ACRC9V_00675 [Aeromonas sp.]